MIILVVIVVGVIILVVIFRAKKRKQQLEINKLHEVKTANNNIEMKFKQERTTETEASSNANQPPYAEIQTEEPPPVPSKSEKLMEYLNPNSTLTGEYSEIEVEPDTSKHVLLAKPPRNVSLSDSMSEEVESSPTYEDVNQHCDPLSTTNVPQGNNIYTEADTVSLHDDETYATVYSEPIQPSLFTDTVETPSDSEDLHPYTPIYTIPHTCPREKSKY